MHVFENRDSWLDTTRAYSFRKDALGMRVILYLCIFVKKDTLEIEFSSIENTPDVTQGFINLNWGILKPL